MEEEGVESFMARLLTEQPSDVQITRSRYSDEPDMLEGWCSGSSKWWVNECWPDAIALTSPWAKSLMMV